MALETSSSSQTLADLLERLGGIDPGRVRMVPPPGTATIEDVVRIVERESRLYELVEGVLVEKGMGFRESSLACALVTFLKSFVTVQNLGVVTGADGMMQLFRGLVRIPDVAYTSWDRLPGGIPTEPVPDLAPDLAVEVLSRSNTEKEMERKREEYFHAGVRAVWIVDPEARTVAVYVNPEERVLLREDDTLDGGEVLPGFALKLRELFAELDRRGPQSES